jgi:hypothetical protein
MITRWLLWLYPAAWRARYAEEFLALLETQPAGPGLVVDVVLNAVDARLHPQIARSSVAATVGGLVHGRSKALERFTGRSLNVLQLADQEAAELGHPFIGTEHLLLGLLGEPKGVATHVLRQLKVDPHDVRAAVQASISSPPHPAAPVRGLTPAAKKAIHLSAEEAQRMQHRFVGTEHILLGLMRQRHGIAAQVLAELSGVDLAEFRRRVAHALEH